MTNSPPGTRPKQGRPRTPANLARPNRVVTFVTDWELEQLERVCREQERSMAAVAHRIIKAHFMEQ